MAVSVPLSVVVPTRDTRELTLACLESVFRAAPEGLEVVLVDDGGTDGTAEEVAARFPGVAVLRHERSQGFTRSANQGLTRATGEVLLLLNSDTEVEQGALAALLAAFEDPGLGAAGATLRYPGGEPQWSGGAEPTLAWFFALASGLPRLLARLPFYRRSRPLAPAARQDVGWVTGAAMALRRAAWEAVGPFDEGFRFYAQDLDLCCRLRQAGWRVALLPEVRVVHHHGATIGRGGGTSRGQHLELLWTDLLRWAGKRHGERWAARAARALRLGGALRLAWLRLAPPFSGERPARDSERRALRAALRALD